MPAVGKAHEEILNDGARMKGSGFLQTVRTDRFPDFGKEQPKQVCNFRRGANG